MLFDGFTAIEKEESAQKKLLPALEVGQVLMPEYISPEQHFTTPPPRYNEASLIKFLEESGIGRPSTYALLSIPCLNGIMCLNAENNLYQQYWADWLTILWYRILNR